MAARTVTVAGNGTETTQAFQTQDKQEISAVLHGTGTMTVDVVWIQEDGVTEHTRQTYSELTDGTADSKIVFEALTCKAPYVQFEITDTSGAQNDVAVNEHAH